jgi:anti-anti-sigma factor
MNGEVMLDKDESGVWIVALRGEHDLATTPGLDGTLAAVLELGRDAVCRPTLVVVDLTTVEFIDSSVLNALAAANAAAAQDPDAELAVVVATPDCFAARLLRLCGLHQVIPTYGSRTAAIEALAGGAGLLPR